MSLLSKMIVIIGIAISSMVSLAEALNVDNSNVFVHGYDLVSYFKESRAVLGNGDHELKYKNVLLNFSNNENKKEFKNHPDKYFPEFGGYCSYGVSMGKKFDIDPSVWKIVNKKLYFHLNQGTQYIWADDMLNNIKIAEQVWPTL